MIEKFRSKVLPPAACRLGIVLAAALLLAGCAKQAPYTEPDYSVAGTRDSTPRVLLPKRDGTGLLGSSDVSLDLSHSADGYFSASYTGDSGKVKLQVTNEQQVTYTYNLPTDGSWSVFPFSSGDGAYTIGVYSNIKDTMYSTVYSTDVSVRLSDAFGPFLYPNQYVWFTKDTKAVQTGAMVCHPCSSDLEAISNVFDYVVHHVSYDWDEAKTVQSDYLPDVDEVLDTGKGICFDYAALMACMLRSQGIPTRMEIGYAGTAYHAWITTYVAEIGWVDGIIRFDGTDWSLMDPTLASSESRSKYESFIQSSDNYRVCYSY